jgi:hypothetical protein
VKLSPQKVAVAVLLAGLATVAGAVSAQARDKDGDRHRSQVYDGRYGHNRYYPGRGYRVPSLPQGYYTARYRGSAYYYRGGTWYRPRGPSFVVIAPPIGIYAPFLPPFYTTVWFGGIPYYYADQTYYRWLPDQRAYVVTEPPGSPDAATTTPPDNTDLFVYPAHGQSEEQQSTDRYECHSWASQQTGFDPTQPLGGVQPAEVSGKRADYQRAETACLEARGYTVR